MRRSSSGQVERLQRVFEEDVGVRAGGVEVEEAEGECALGAGGDAVDRGVRLGRQAVGRGQAKAVLVFRQKDCDARYQQGARQALDDGFEQGMEIGLGTQAAAEFNQGLAVVVAVAVEDAIDPALDTTLQGLENRGDDQDREPQSPLADSRRHVDVNLFGGQGHDAEVAAQEQTGGEGVGHTALEDEVSVHQPVANDGPAESQRQEDDGEAGDTVERPGKANVEQERHGIKERERNHGKERAASEPLELLPKQGSAGAVIAAQEQGRREDVEDGLVGCSGLVHAVLEEPGGLPVVHGEDPQAKQGGSGSVDDRQQPGTVGAFEALLREAEGEMDKQRRLQRISHNIGPEDGPV